MRKKYIDRVTKLNIPDGVELWHICWKYKDTIKTVYCKLCATKERNAKYKLVK